MRGSRKGKRPRTRVGLGRGVGGRDATRFKQSGWMKINQKVQNIYKTKIQIQNLVGSLYQTQWQKYNFRLGSFP